MQILRFFVQNDEICKFYLFFSKKSCTFATVFMRKQIRISTYLIRAPRRMIV